MTVELATKAFGAFELKSADRGEVEAVVATLGVLDRDREVIQPGAIQDGAQVTVSAFGHDAMFGALPAGKGAIHVAGNRAVFQGRLFLSTDRGRDTLSVLKEMGPTQQWSFGFEVLQSESPSAEWRARGAQRILTKLNPFEVSPVMRGAGVGTGTLSAKQAHPADCDVAALAEELARTCDRTTTQLEPGGALALHVARWAAKRLHSPWPAPLVRFFEPDGERNGYFTAATPDRVFVAKGLALEDLVRVVIHEVAHQADWPNDSEALAEHAAALLAPSYLDQYGLHDQGDFA
jgi:hypothetical protein